VVAGDSLGPQEAADSLGLDPVAYDCKPNREHQVSRPYPADWAQLEK
jgi:hypothetical protein